MDFSDGRVRTLRATERQGVALSHLSVAVLGLGAGETDGTHVGLAAGVRASRPVDLQLFGKIQFLVKFLSGCKCLVLGVREGESAVGAAGAGHRSGGDRAGLKREPLQQRIGLEGVDSVGGKSHEDHVLVFGETHFTTAVIKACCGQILQIPCFQAPDRNMHACEGQAVLFLWVDAVVGAGRGVEHRAGIRGERSEALLDHVAEGFQAHLIEIEAEPTLGTLVPFTVVAPDLDHGIGHRTDLIRLHPGIEGNGVGIHLRGENTTDPNAEAHHAITFDGMEHDVVVEQKIILGTSDRCVPFARQV